MPIRDSEGEEFDGITDSWFEDVWDEEAAEELTEEIVESGEKAVEFVSERDPETGMRPVTMPKKTAKRPSARGRHVGAKALSLISRIPLVGLKWLKASREFVVYDNQPPPSGEYAVQALGISTIEYDGVQQNHLLVTFKAGQLTGFGMEDTYLSYEHTYATAVTDELIDIQTLLSTRNGRTVGLFASHDVSIRFNSETASSITIAANQCPFIIDLGLNLQYLYITTTKADTKIKLVGW